MINHVFFALKHFLHFLQGHHVNSTVVVYINCKGGTRSLQLHKLAWKIIKWSSSRLLSLRATHVPGVLNRCRSLCLAGKCSVSIVFLPIGHKCTSKKDKGVCIALWAWPVRSGTWTLQACLRKPLTPFRVQGPHPLILFTVESGGFLWRGATPFLYQCSVVDLLCFVQELVDKGKAFSTIKVYSAAISSCHVGFGDKLVWQHPLVCCFIQGARLELPVSRPLIPLWDLSVVLDALYHHPFEPIEAVEKFISLKTVLLLSVCVTYRLCPFAFPACTKVCMRPNPAFVPKVVAYRFPTVELLAFYPPPFSSVVEQRSTVVIWRGVPRAQFNLSVTSIFH